MATTERATTELVRARPPSRVALGWAFVERQTNLWKRHWAWELVWLVYGVVNTLAITFIAKEAAQTGDVSSRQLSQLTLFLLIGTLVWAYMSAVLDDMSLVIMWERWEGTIEHTLMAPVPRVVHLLGMSVFGVLHGLIRTSLILACSLPFFSVDLGHADWAVAAAVDHRWAASAWSVWASFPGSCPCCTPSGASRCRSWSRPWCC